MSFSSTSSTSASEAGYRRAWKRLRLLLIGGFATAAMLAAPGSAQAGRPNIVIIQTDDQNERTVDATFKTRRGKKARVMPNTAREIFGDGTRFENFYVPSPVCSPSRASLLTGQYPANHGVTQNDGANGGWQGYRSRSIFNRNLPVAMQAAGYRTSHFGKYTNGYFDPLLEQVETTVPPGWNNWFTNSYSVGTLFYGYNVNDNGVPTGPFGDAAYSGDGIGLDSKRCTADLLLKPRLSGDCNYLTDKMTRAAVREIKQNRDGPLFMHVDYQAPHGDSRPPVGPQPASRHAGSADRTPLPRPENFNEADMSDKSSLIQSFATPRLGWLDNQRLKRNYRPYIESLRAVDDGVGAIIKTLRRTDRLDDTYIFFLSDHGFFLGEHRFDFAKFLPYEASSSVAMAVRGPRVPEGSISNEVVSNVDIAPTALRLAGGSPGYRVDGRPLQRFWRDPDKLSRRAIGLTMKLEGGDVDGGEGDSAGSDGASVSATAPALRFDGFRVGPYKYIRFNEAGGEAELYNLERDPAEMKNRINSLRYAKVRRYMERHFEQVNSCAGSQCRVWLPRWPEPGL